MKICYILPKYDVATEEHFFHNYSFLEMLGKELDIFLIIERCKGKPEIQHIKKIYTQKFSHVVFRSIEFMWIFFLIRLKGIKKFYVHYSFFGGFLGSVFCKLFGGEVYYWHCVTVVYKKVGVLSLRI